MVGVHLYRLGCGWVVGVQHLTLWAWVGGWGSLNFSPCGCVVGFNRKIVCFGGVCVIINHGLGVGGWLGLTAQSLCT